ncbi:MAG: MYXO-CTERM sorting domain-containing protein [Nannocystaceae bacterium]
MRRLHRLILAAVAVATLSVPGVARAIVVECANDHGSCTVSNDPFDEISCTCGDEAGTVTTGVDSWNGYTEEQLQEACEGWVDDVCQPPFESDGTDPTFTSGNDTSNAVTGDDTGGTEGTESEGTTDATATESDSDATSGTSGGTDDPSTSGDETTSPPETTANDSSGSGSGSDSGSSSDSDSDSGTASETGGESSGGATTGQSSGDGSSTDSGGSSGETGGNDGVKQGCAIEGEAGSLGALALAGLLLIGGRRRRVA